MMQPEHICFSPLNWRHITVSYKSEINIWHLEQCDNKRFKTSKTRFILPAIKDESQIMIFPEFKDEFSYPLNSITNLDEELGTRVEEILDKRERHIFKTLCWSSSGDEILFVTASSYIFRVN